MKPQLLATFIFAMTAAPFGAHADSNSNVESAYYLCALVDKTGLASAPCEVSGWNSTITATIDMNSGEARDLCAKISGFMQQQGKTFDPGWTFHIRSPYSGTNSIAYCNL